MSTPTQYDALASASIQEGSAMAVTSRANLQVATRLPRRD
jgi:hypothetical protein